MASPTPSSAISSSVERAPLGPQQRGEQLRAQAVVQLLHDALALLGGGLLALFTVVVGLLQHCNADLRAGWAWLRPFRRLDEYERALAEILDRYRR